MEEIPSRFGFGALCAEAEYGEGVILNLNTGAIHNEVFQMIGRDGQADDPAAFAAEHMLMASQFTVKTICLSGDGYAPHLADGNQRIQVTIHRAQAEPGANGPQGSADLLRSGVIGAGQNFLQNQFALM